MLRVVLAFLTITSVATGRQLLARDTTFNWTTLQAQSNLTRSPCYGDLQCAKLTYADPTAGIAELALAISPSLFAADDPRYRGPLLFNPGGPGGSGVQYLVALEDYFRERVGPGYDIVGFDPRGVGDSTPRIAFFESPAEALALFATYPVSLNDRASAFGRAYALSEIMGELAIARQQVVLESVGTAAIARDMLEITHAFGFEKVTYWGISYGTVIGSAFAAAFPDKIAGMILDGVLNAHEWFAGVDTTSLLSASDALDAFYTACAAAGPNACALAAATPEAVRSRVDALLFSLQIAPVPVRPATALGVVDAPLLLDQLYETLISPYASGAAFAAAVAALETGDGAPIYANSSAASIGALAAAPSSEGNVSAGFIDIVAPIACGDSGGRGLRTLADSRVEYDGVVAQENFWNVLFGLLTGPCATWNISAKDALNGTFVTNTSAPILLISNIRDPLTPIHNGMNMFEGFAGSVLLTQNSTGHTSLAAPSTCTDRAILAYFENGTLPAAGTVYSDAACCAFLADIQENPFDSVQCAAEAHEALRLVLHGDIAISPALEAQGTFGSSSPPIATLGQDTDALVDCSDIISAPKAQNFGATVLPAGKSLADVEQACAETPFPSLSTAPGPATSVARIPPPPGA
ncbi:hypothetical protein PHLGIDRAFT_117965 [Phlebiopsis gigantea 11061_1 CR5-6]|uniref:AB hydrolase-1 domain-containing protein n=1 Tax=Phlebiopsis gigantea (strain 11061_1 CR5-6) TaxID=745531 RepID=A0A0C3S8N9_PHLG1|nr:hypothetical protein PHLGIDRAFT_117965 [Phlebiopsis gigantea 11061_1 CR5-6]